MKRLTTNIAASVIVLPALVLGAFLLTGIGRGQSTETAGQQPSEPRRLVKPTILIIDRVGKPTSKSNPFRRSRQPCPEQ
jgi:hypothetical protein